jgi:hypothetical protein
VGKNRKDAVGGHAKRDFEIGDCTGWTQGFRRFAKDRANRMLRRQFKAAHKAAILEYEVDHQEWLDWQSAEDYAMDKYMEYYGEYDVYLIEIDREEQDRVHDDRYDREMRYEAEREFESFVYDRDMIDRNGLEPDWY